MTNKISTEEKIFNSARKVFIHYGFHGTTINKIAVDARVNKATIHYYFRSKEKLYAQVVKYELNYMLSSRDNFISEQIWFFNTEQYNNKKLFDKTLKEIYINDWNEILNTLNRILENR